MFPIYKIPQELGIEFSQEYFQKYNSYHQQQIKLEGKYFWVDFIPINVTDMTRFVQSANNAFISLSTLPKTNIPFSPIAAWSIIANIEPLPTFLILMTECTDGKISLEEISQNEIQRLPNVVDKTKIMYALFNIYEYVNKLDSHENDYFMLTQKCIFLNKKNEPSFAYFGLQYLKEFIQPDTYSLFFSKDKLPIDHKIPNIVNYYGAMHWKLESLGEQPISFEQSIFSQCLKKNADFFKNQQSPFAFIASCFDPKTSKGLYYKGVKPKEYSKVLADLSKFYKSVCSDYDETQSFAVAPTLSSASPNNVFSKFIQSFIIPYHSDPFCNLVCEEFQKYLSMVNTKLLIQYSFFRDHVKRGFNTYIVEAVNVSHALTIINQEFIDNLKKAAFIGSIDALYYIAHFSLMQYDGDAPEEIIQILKTIGELGYNNGSFEYATYNATTSYLSSLNLQTKNKTRVFKQAIPYFEMAAKRNPLPALIMAFFGYLINDFQYSLKLLSIVEKVIPKSYDIIKFVQEKASHHPKKNENKGKLEK